MKVAFLLFFVIPITFCSYGQNNDWAYLKIMTASIEVNQYFELYGISPEDLKNIKGSPYDKNHFLLGNIYSNGDLKASNIRMRYNIFADEIEINTSQDPHQQNINALSKSPDIFVKIDSDVYVYVENLSSEEHSGYYKVVSEGKYFALYKKSHITYVEKRFADTNYQQNQPARFDRTDVFYLVDSRGGFYELPNNRRRFTAIFKEHNKEIESFVKSNKLDIGDENDLEKIVKYFNEIL